MLRGTEDDLRGSDRAEVAYDGWFVDHARVIGVLP
jgi:hypothetical protein